MSRGRRPTRIGKRCTTSPWSSSRARSPVSSLESSAPAARSRRRSAERASFTSSASELQTPKARRRTRTSRGDGRRHRSDVRGSGMGCNPNVAPGGEFIAGGSGTADSCFGDSGGPVYLDTPAGPVLIGRSRVVLTARRRPAAAAASTSAPTRLSRGSRATAAADGREGRAATGSGKRYAAKATPAGDDDAGDPYAGLGGGCYATGSSAVPARCALGLAALFKRRRRYTSPVCSFSARVRPIRSRKRAELLLSGASPSAAETCPITGEACVTGDIAWRALALELLMRPPCFVQSFSPPSCPSLPRWRSPVTSGACRPAAKDVPRSWFPDVVAVLTVRRRHVHRHLARPDLVLTAGHCADAEPVEVVIGSVDLANTAASIAR